MTSSRLLIESLGKKFNRNWIFRNISLELKSGDFLAVLGGNGSGKSTFIQCVLGSSSHTTGRVSLFTNNGRLDDEKFPLQISITAPYVGLYEDLTLRESIDFHCKFRKLLDQMNAEQFAHLTSLETHIDKPLSQYSSGMKQRVKLGLALYTDSRMVLLDEPCSHLDENGITWYKQQIESRKAGRIILVASNNMETETWFCQHQIRMENHA